MAIDGSACAEDALTDRREKRRQREGARFACNPADGEQDAREPQNQRNPLVFQERCSAENLAENPQHGNDEQKFRVDVLQKIHFSFLLSDVRVQVLRASG